MKKITIAIDGLSSCGKSTMAKDLAKKIGTYETSILPYEDCCVVFSPKHPLVHPDKQTASRHFLDLQMDELLQKAVRETVAIDFNVHGTELKEAEA